MTDLNKVRDEVCEAFADQRKDRKLGTHDNHEWVELVMAGRNAFDAAIAHLSKQSVEFDESAVVNYQIEVESVEGDFVDGARWQHQQTALLYEAKLAVAVEALNWMMRYADHTSQCNSIDSWAKKCSCGFDSGWKMQKEALEKLGAK